MSFWGTSFLDDMYILLLLMLNYLILFIEMVPVPFIPKCLRPNLVPLTLSRNIIERPSAVAPWEVFGRLSAEQLLRAGYPVIYQAPFEGMSLPPFPLPLHGNNCIMVPM